MTKTQEILLLSTVSVGLVASIIYGYLNLQRSPAVDTDKALTALQQSVCNCNGDHACIDRVYPVDSEQDIEILFGKKAAGSYQETITRINDCAGLVDQTKRIAALRQDAILAQMLARVGLDHKKDSEKKLAELLAMEDKMREKQSGKTLPQAAVPDEPPAETQETPDPTIAVENIPTSAINRTIAFVDDKNRRSVGQLVDVDDNLIRVRYMLKTGIVETNTDRKTIQHIAFSHDKHQMKKPVFKKEY
jgi:hypothetical protein